MDSDRLNRWITLGANLGVLVGIVLLLIELDQNRDMMRAQTRHQLAMGLVELQITTGTNQQLVELMERAANGEELVGAEGRQVWLRFNALIRYWENVHYQYRQGLYDEIEYVAQREAWRISFANGPAMTIGVSPSNRCSSFAEKPWEWWASGASVRLWLAWAPPWA